VYLHGQSYDYPPELPGPIPPQHYVHLHFPQSPIVDLTYDFSSLLLVTWNDDAAPFYNANSISTIGSMADAELSTPAMNGNLLPPIPDALIPEDEGTSTSSLPNESNSTSPLDAQEFNVAVPLVCYACPHRPSFGKPHQYK
jgi:hypothetical protein